MHNTSELYQKLLAGNHTTEVRLTIGETGRLITKRGEAITFGGVSILVGSSGADGGYDESSLVSMRTDIQLFSEDTVTVGSCVSGEIDVQMLKPLGDIPRQARLVPYIRLVHGAERSEWVQKGVYFVDTRDVDTDNSSIEYLSMHGYDSMLKAEQDYPASTLDWPATDIQVIEEIAAFLDVSVDARTYEYITSAYAIQYPADYSCRDVLGYIASMYAGCFIMSDLGDLRFVPFYAIPKETRYLVSHDRQIITFGGDRILV